MFSVHDKVALVTGGSKGIGRSIALGLAEQGAKVILAARDREALSATQELIRNRGYACDYVAMDVTSEDSVFKAVKSAETIVSGAIDILINNAGMSAENVKAEEMEEVDWLHVMDVNLNGYFRVGKAVARGMIEKRSGKIINISSVLGTTAVPLGSAYCVSKGAINQLTKAWAVEWARYNIQVNAVAPAFISTDINRKQFEDEKFKKKILSRIPAGRMEEADDLIGPITFLSCKASDYVTGHVLNVDGGWCSAL